MLPNAPHLNNFPVLGPVFETWAPKLGVPYELLVAQSYQESQWTTAAYRYEPNYDYRYISCSACRWSKDPAWLGLVPTGPQLPSIADWFTAHPARAAEQVAGRDYSMVAQTRIAASYGALQIMYPTAVSFGYSGTPEALADPTNLEYPLTNLLHLLDQARLHWTGQDAMKVALAQYNGGFVGNLDPKQLRDIQYVRDVEHRYQQLWSKSFFGPV